jgi:hypothetical protein
MFGYKCNNIADGLLCVVEHTLHFKVCTVSRYECMRKVPPYLGRCSRNYKCSTELLYVQMLYRISSKSDSNVESRDRSLFTPLSKVWLLIP